EGQAEVARLRQSVPRTLQAALRKELEWIPLKAMRKQPVDRYAGVRELAADIQNYLAGRPLEAGPESASYRMRKLLWRHRGKATAAAIVLLALILGLTGTLWAMHRANLAARSESHLR